MKVTDGRHPVAFQSVTSARQAACIAHRWAMTFGRLRTRSRLAGSLAYPMMWVIDMTLVGLHAHQVAQVHVAAGLIPNPITRPYRPLWRAVALGVSPVLAFLVFTVLAPPWPALAVLPVIAIALAIAVLIEAIMALRTQRRGGALRNTAAKLRERRSGPVVIGSMFGAWPKHTGAGTALLRAALAEQARSGVSMLVLATDTRTADWYVHQHHGVRIDPAHPLHIAWLNP